MSVKMDFYLGTKMNEACRADCSIQLIEINYLDYDTCAAAWTPYIFVLSEYQSSSDTSQTIINCSREKKLFRNVF